MIENRTPNRRAEERVEPGTLAQVGRRVAALASAIAAVGLGLAASAP